MDTQKLRQRILDLAIRGKLVPQDPNDEPASVLLDRIRAEKERLIAEGKIKRPKAKKSTDKSHYQQFTLPFDIPDSWEWVRLKDIAYVASGSTPSKESFVPHGIPYLKMYNLRKQKIDFQYQPQYISEEVHNGKLSRSRATTGDIIMNIVGPPLGKLAIIPTTIKECNFNQAAVMIRPFYLKDILAEYLFNYLEEMSEINCISTKGTAGQVNISLTQAQNMRISLPPIGEMIRINEKVRQYRSVFETLDNNSNELIDSIAKAKSKILDLAMQGKLVAQDPADEPAADMLRRINPKAKIITDTPHYILRPKGWIFSELYNVSRIIMGQSPNGDSINNVDGIEFHQGKMYFGDIFISVSPDKTNSPTKVIDGENILLSVRAPVGAVNKCNRKICIGRGLAAISPSEVLDETFLFYIFQFLRPEFEAKATGSTFKAITRVVVKSALIPIPPINEQRRIVARVMELYSVLDEIESSLRS